MRRFKAIASHVFLTAFGVLIGGLGLFLLHGGVDYLPCLEGWAFPVVKIQNVSALYRDKERACFALRIVKLRPADPIVYQFAVEARQNEHWLSPVTVNAYLANDDNTRSGDTEFTAHGVGAPWLRHWCFEMPAIVADAQVIRVSGHAIHRAHPLWKTETQFPDFTLAAL